MVLAIVDFQRDEPSRDPSLEYLALIAGMESDVFQRRMIGLEEEGLISVEATDTGLSVLLSSVAVGAITLCGRKVVGSSPTATHLSKRTIGSIRPTTLRH